MTRCYTNPCLPTYLTLLLITDINFLRQCFGKLLSDRHTHIQRDTIEIIGL